MGIAEIYRGASEKPLSGPRINLEEAMERLKTIFQRKGVVLAYLFGSYARGEANNTSDIDIAIFLDCERKELYSLYRDLLLRIYEALGTERVDLLLLNDATIVIQFEIISQGRLIYSRDDHELNVYEINVIRKFQDTVYLRKVQNDYLKKRAKEWYSKKKVF